MQLFESGQNSPHLTRKFETDTKSDSDSGSMSAESIQIPVTEFSESSATEKEDRFTETILQLTNELRAQYGLSPLRMNRELSKTARKHSQAMAEGDFFNHVSPNGLRPSDRAAAEGYTAQTLGENIAAGQATPEQVFQGWLESEGHRQNMLNPNYTELGVGYFSLQNDTGEINYYHYWTQVFGSGNLSFDRSTNGFIERVAGELDAIDDLRSDDGLIRVLTLTDEGTVQLSDELSYRLESVVVDGQRLFGEGSSARELAVIQVDSRPVLVDVSF